MDLPERPGFEERAYREPTPGPLLQQSEELQQQHGVPLRHVGKVRTCASFPQVNGELIMEQKQEIVEARRIHALPSPAEFDRTRTWAGMAGIVIKSRTKIVFSAWRETSANPSEGKKSAARSFFAVRT